MAISPGLMQLCFELDRFQIATAIGHISKDVFVHWNHSFEDRLSLNEGEMRRVELRSIIVPDAPIVEASGATESSLSAGLFSDCVIRVPGDGRQVLGRAVRCEGGFIRVVLCPASGTRASSKYAPAHLFRPA